MRLLRAAQRSKVLLMLRAVVDAASVAEHPQAPAARVGYRWLARIERQAPDAVDAVLRHPAVGGWAVQTLLDLSSSASARAEPGRLAAVAAATAIRGGVSCEVMLPPPAPGHAWVELPSLGRAELPSPDVRSGVRGPVHLVSDARGTEVVGGGRRLRLPQPIESDADGWQPVRVLHAEVDGSRIELRLDDIDSYRLPGFTAVGERVAATELRFWRERLQDAWRTLVRGHPDTAAEVAAAVTALTPIQAPRGGHASATSRKTFGCVALSLPDDGQAMALVFAHEVQHAKLTALMDLFPMIEHPSGARRYYAPWRDDPRPLAAFLHGIYAHLGVAGFWRRERHLVEGADRAFHAHAEFVRWRDASARAAASLHDSADLTEKGRLLVQGMARRLDAWAGDPVPVAAYRTAACSAAAHEARWLRNNVEASESAPNPACSEGSPLTAGARSFDAPSQTPGAR